MLYLHPSIQKAGGEVHFFDRDENYLKGLDWYRKKMPHSFRGQITIEKSPSYFVSPEVGYYIRLQNRLITVDVLRPCLVSGARESASYECINKAFANCKGARYKSYFGFYSTEESWIDYNVTA